MFAFFYRMKNFGVVILKCRFVNMAEKHDIALKRLLISFTDVSRRAFASNDRCVFAGMRPSS